MDKPQLKEVYLNGVKVVFANLNTPKAYAEGDVPRYSVSLALEKGSDNFNKLVKAIKDVAVSNKLKEEKVKSLLASKFKDLPDGVDQYVSDLGEDYKMFNASSKSEPDILDKFGASTEAKVFSGDTINIKLVLGYYKKFDKLAAWPNKIAIFEKATRKDPEWDKMLAKKDVELFDEKTEDSAAKPKKVKNAVSETVTEEDFGDIEF